MTTLETDVPCRKCPASVLPWVPQKGDQMQAVHCNTSDWPQEQSSSLPKPRYSSAGQYLIYTKTVPRLGLPVYYSYQFNYILVPQNI